MTSRKRATANCLYDNTLTPFSLPAGSPTAPGASPAARAGLPNRAARSGRDPHAAPGASLRLPTVRCTCIFPAINNYEWASGRDCIHFVRHVDLLELAAEEADAQPDFEEEQRGG